LSTLSARDGHIRNAYSEAGEVNEKQSRLKATFEQITETEEQAANND